MAHSSLSGWGHCHRVVLLIRGWRDIANGIPWIRILPPKSFGSPCIDLFVGFNFRFVAVVPDARPFHPPGAAFFANKLERRLRPAHAAGYLILILYLQLMLHLSVSPHSKCFRVRQSKVGPVHWRWRARSFCTHVISRVKHQPLHRIRDFLDP